MGVLSLSQHPFKRDLRQSALSFVVSTAYIRVIAGEPYLLDVSALLRAPEILPEKLASLIYSHCMPDAANDWIPPRIGKLQWIEHSADAAHRIPQAEEMNLG